MLSLLLDIFIMGIFFVSLYGWGAGLIKIIYKKNDEGYVYPAVLGMAVWVFLGGVLNMARVAYPYMLDIIVVFGWLFALLIYRPKHFKDFKSIMQGNTVDIFSVKGMGESGSGYYVVLILFLYVALYWLSTLVPMHVYNHHDDFHKYIYPAYRMFAMGTLAGDPFSILGFDSIGGQAFLQAFVVNHFSVEYIGSFDTVFCFLLVGLLLLSIAKRFDVHWMYVLLVIVTLILLNPQVVNISSVYSAVLIMIGLVYSSSILLDSRGVKTSREQIYEVIPFALFLSSLAVLKTTYIPFAGVYFFTLFGLVLLRSDGRKEHLKKGFVSGLVSIIMLVPWLVSHASNYILALKMKLGGTVGNYMSDATLLHENGAVSDSFLFKLFSTKEAFWGGKPYGSSVLMVFLLLIAIAYVFKYMGSREPEKIDKYFLPLVASCASVIAIYIIFLIKTNADDAIRYVTPIIIAVLTSSILLIGHNSRLASDGYSGARAVVLRVLFFMFLNLVLIDAFYASSIARLAKAYNYQTAVGFPINKKLIEYSNYVFSDAAHNKMKNMQATTKEGDGIMAFVSMSHHLDFQRNKVFVLAETSYLAPWINFPIGVEDKNENLRSYLIGRGVRFVMWEYQGFGMRSLDGQKRMLASPNIEYRKQGLFNIRLRAALRSLGVESEVLYSDDNYVVYDLQSYADIHLK